VNKLYKLARIIGYRNEKEFCYLDENFEEGTTPVVDGLRVGNWVKLKKVINEVDSPKCSTTEIVSEISLIDLKESPAFNFLTDDTLLF
jgi:hypothetical protein